MSDHYQDTYAFVASLWPASAPAIPALSALRKGARWLRWNRRYARLRHNPNALRNASEHSRPVALALLAKQTGSGIPRAVFAMQKPTPVRDPTQRDKNRTPQRSTQMDKHGA